MINQKFVKYSLIVASILGATFIVYSLIVKRRQEKGLNQRVAKILVREYDFWHPKGQSKRVETDSAVRSRLNDYWKSVGKTIDQMGTGTPWSSAFISYTFKEGGANDDFKYSPSHSTYIIDSINNRKKDNKESFYGYRTGEKKVEVGDIITYPRQSGVSYDSLPSYFMSHGDAVYSVDYKNRIAYAIGGNVSNSVTITEYKLDSEGRLIPQNKGGYPLLAHIKNESK